MPATIEVSNDGGTTWTQLTTCSEYLGTSSFCGSAHKFTAASYLAWDPVNNATQPQQSWWRTEAFDVSAYLSNTSQARIRFKLEDGNNNGANLNYGWLVDNVKVTVSPSELFPPTIVLNSPVWLGPTSSPGPYLISADITDGSGIDTAMVIYSLNGAPDDTIGLINTTGSTFEDTIPGAAIDDSICYRVFAVDASPAANTAVEPLTSCNTFTIVPAPPQIQLGNGTATNTGFSYPAPYGNFYMGARHQMLITAAEMNNAGVSIPIFFQSLAFNVINVNGAALSDFTIKMGNYSGSSLSNWVSGGLSTVYYSPAYTEFAGWNVHAFQMPFQWDGASNIIIEVCFNNYPLQYTNNAAVQQTTYSSTRTIYYRSDTDPNLCANNSAFATPSNDRPNMRFDLVLPQDRDFGTTAFLAPTDGGCDLSSAEPVTVQFKNFGLDDQDTLIFNYQVDANPVVTDTVYQTVISGDDIVHTFSVPADLSIAATTYQFTAWTSLPGDNNTFNDTLSNYTITNTLTTGMNLVQDFDGWTSGGQVLSDFWEQDDTDSYNWTVGTGPSPGAGTGPNGDHTTGSANYLYTENNFTAVVARVISPCLDFTGNTYPKVDFWYHMWGTGIGALNVDYLDNTGTWVNAWSLSGQQGNSWQKAIVDLAPLANQVSRIRISHITAGFGCELAIDDILIYESAADDAILDDILQPVSQLVAGASETVQVEFFNNGSNSITSIDLGYIIGNSAPVIESWTGNLSPSTSAFFTFTTPFTVPGGTFSICAFTDLVGDGIPLNDTMCTSSTGIQTFIPPYTNDFESGQGSWVAEGGLEQWELGQPSTFTINAANSPANCWVIDLDDFYAINSNDYLYSPFFDLSDLYGCELRFANRYDCDVFGDGGQIEISTDGGQSWSLLGFLNDPLGTNWYNTNSGFPGQPSWAGNNGSWINTTFDLSAYDVNPGLIQFRFRFFSDNFGLFGGDGWAIDDFEIFVPIQNSAASIDYDIGASSAFVLPDDVPVSVWIRNTGIAPLASVDANLDVDNGAFTISEPVSIGIPLAHGDSILHTFGQLWTASPGPHTLCVHTSNPNGTMDTYTMDDTLCTLISVFDSTSAISYCDDFDSGAPQWITLNAFDYSLTTQWEVGTPDQTVLNGAYSGTNAWMTGLNSDYEDNDSSALYTPVFNVNNVNCYRLSFYHRYFTDEYEDGGTVEYTQDNGITWTTIGLAFEPTWFDSQFITGLGSISRESPDGPEPVWDGSSPHMT